MHYSASQVLRASGTSINAFKNWQRLGVLNVPPAVPAKRKARKYGLANAYEMALLPLVAAFGLMTLERAKRLVGDRFNVVGATRAESTGRPYGGFRDFVADPAAWLGEEFAYDNLESPLVYILTGPATRRITCIDIESAHSLQAVRDSAAFGTINVTRLFHTTRHLLAGGEPPKTEGGWGDDP